MTIAPPALSEPQLGLIRSGQVRCIVRRAASLIATLRPGDLLWIRESFWLEARFDAYAPTAALDLGARPWFTPLEGSDARGTPLVQGRSRFARELPKAWHRNHLFVTSTCRAPLFDLAADAAISEGFDSIDAYRRAWEARPPFAGNRVTYDSNPEMVKIGISFIDKPLPATACPTCGALR